MTDVFYGAQVGGLEFQALVSADGPYIKCGLDGVALVVSTIRYFTPNTGRFGGVAGWYVVKYRDQARIHLPHFDKKAVETMCLEFGLCHHDKALHIEPANPQTAFYASQAWQGLVRWVKAHPRLAKRFGQYDSYLPGWYELALKQNAVGQAK